MATAVQMDKVFTAQTATGNSTAYNWPGGIGQFIAEGTWGGATCKMQMSPDDGTTWIDVGSDVTLTADGIGNFELGACDIRASLTTAGTTSIDCWMTVRHGRAIT